MESAQHPGQRGDQIVTVEVVVPTLQDERSREIMRELARENGIPIIEDTALARLLYRRVKVGRAVPAETYRAVAAILAFVYRVLGRNGAAQVRAARGAA